MHKVVVVDDEVRQSKGLKNILMRQFNNLEIEAFSEANAALEYIRREKVKLIITDICMPEMDGLELTKRIKEMDEGAKIILLTGFAEFEYARAAITLGAFDYLLKPMNPDKLKDELERAIHEIEAEQVLNKQQEHMQKQLDMAFPVYMEKLLNQWVYGWASDEEKKEIEKIIPLHSEGLIIVTKLKGLYNWQLKIEKKGILDGKKQITWCMRRLFGKPYHVLSFFSHILPETMVTILTHTRQKIETVQLFDYPMIIKKLYQLPNELAEDEIKPIIGVGCFSLDLIQDIEQIYKSAVTALEYQFYFPKTKVLEADIILPQRIFQMNISLAEEEFIKDAIREGDAKKAKSALTSILERCMSSGCPEPSRFKNNCESLLKHVALSLHSEQMWQVKENDSIEDNYELFIASANNYLEGLAQEISMKKLGRNTEFAQKYLDYLKQNYYEDIPLESIAEYFRLTPAYFSTLVKEVTGTSFSKGLIEIRIKKAKELLKKTNLKVYKIAESVGYNDVKYFNRVFKKEIGITPIQYRDDLKDMEE